MVRTSLAIGREVVDTRSIQDMGASTKRKENQSSYSSGKKKKTSIHRDFRDGSTTIRARPDQGF